MDGSPAEMTGSQTRCCRWNHFLVFVSQVSPNQMSLAASCGAIDDEVTFAKSHFVEKIIAIQGLAPGNGLVSFDCGHWNVGRFWKIKNGGLWNMRE